MAKMMNPELEVVRFENEDVIALSAFYINGNGEIIDKRTGSRVDAASNGLSDGNKVQTGEGTYGNVDQVSQAYKEDGYWYLGGDGNYHWHSN